MKKCISVTLAEVKMKLGPSWKRSPNCNSLTGELAEAERELCRRDSSFVPAMIKRPPLTDAQRTQLHADIAKRKALTSTGASGDLWSTYNALKTPAEKRDFYLANKKAMG